jgi:hypothetical protein
MEQIDLTPTWTAILPLLIHMIRQGGEGGDTARAELMSLAAQVDAINAKIRAEAKAEAEAEAEAPRVIHCDGCSQRFPRDEMTFHDSHDETFALCERCKQADRAYTDGG